MPASTPGATSETARIVVTGGEIERSAADTAQTITVLSGDKLKKKPL